MSKRTCNSYLELVVKFCRDIERLEILCFSESQLVVAHLAIEVQAERAMFQGAEDSRAMAVVLVSREGVVNDSNFRNAIDCKPNEHSDGTEVSHGEVFSSIKRVNPNCSILSAECVKGRVKFIAI